MGDRLAESEVRRPAGAVVLASLASVLWYVCVVGFWAAPAALRLGGERVLSAALARPVEIASVRFNPFTFELGVFGLRVYEPGGGEVFFSLESLLADIEPSRALWGRIAVKDVLIDGPVLRLARRPDGSLNVADLLGPDSSPPPEGARAGFDISLPAGLNLELANVLLRSGKAVFADEPRGASHEITDLHFYLPYFSAQDTGRRTIVETSSVVDASPFEARLVVDFSGERPRLSYTSRLRQVRLARFKAYAPIFKDIDASADSAALDVEASFAASGWPEVRADLDLAGIRLAAPDGWEFFKADALGVEDARYDFASGGVRVARVVLRGYQADLRLARDGGLALPWLAAKTSKPGQAEPALRAADGVPKTAGAPPGPANPEDAQPAPAPRPDLKLDRLILEQGAVRLDRPGPEDGGVAGRYVPAVVISQAEVSGWGIDLGQGVIDQIDLTIASDVCPKAWLRYSGSIAPPAGQAYFAFQGCDVRRIADLAPRQPGQPYVTAAASLSGTINLSLDKGEPSLHLTKGKVELRQIGLAPLPGTPITALSLDRLALDGIEAAYPARTVSVAMLAASTGGADLLLDAPLQQGRGGKAQGPDPLASTPSERPGKQNPRAAASSALSNLSPASAKTSTSGITPPPFVLRLEDISVERFGLNFTGKSLAKPLVAQVERLAVRDAAYPPKGPIKAELALNLYQLGRVEASAEIAPSLAAARGRLKTHALSLPDLARLLPPQPLIVNNGTATVDGSFAVALPAAGEPQAQFDGDIKLASLAVARPGEARGAWVRSLSIDKLKATTAPLAVAAEAVDLDGGSAKLELAKDGRILVAGLEVARTATPQQGQPGQQDPSAQDAGPAQGGQPAQAAPLPLTVHQIKVSGARVDFTDQTFSPPFTANVVVDAQVKGLAPSAPLTLDLAAVVNGTGKIKASGALAPPPLDPAFDLKAGIDNLDLAEGSPYAKRFTGFPISTGKLKLSGDYKLAQGQLDLKNKINVSHIRVGPKAPDAQAGVPLDMAVSLLADASGNIDLDVPVTGDLRGVKVDLGQAIGKAMGSVFAKVLLGPFAFLGTAGKGGQTMPLPFAPGSAAIEGPAAERLDGLAKALAGAPKANLEITGYADQATETEGVKRYALRAKVAEGVGRAGQTLSDADYARFLGRYYTRATGGKNPGSQAAMEAELLSSFTLDPSDAQHLAKYRAAAARDYLVAHGVGEANLFLVPPDNPTPKPVQGVPNSRVEVTLRR